MAGDWIKMRTALANDPAVIAIALDLDKSEFEVVGMLHHLWSWADSQSQDGHIKRVTEKWIDRYVHQNGFAKSMCDAGWLILENDGITFPNFERHNGESAKKRAEAAERQRISRENKKAVLVTDPSQETCDKSVTREEKRREDQKPLKAPPTPKPKKTKQKSDFVLPDWIDRKAWDDFLAMRKEIKKPITENAKALAVKKLEAFAAQGHNPTAILNQSTFHSWQGLFEVKNGSGQTNGQRSGPASVSLLDQVRINNENRANERARAAGQNPAQPTELRNAGVEENGAGREWEGEFARVRDSDGKVVGADD